MRSPLPLILVLSAVWSSHAMGQPQPGDVFREYVWIPKLAEGDQGRFLRVGGRMGYKASPDHMPKEHHKDGYILFGDFIQLKNALRAEVQVEKIQSHDDTKGLRISFNDNEFLFFPTTPDIPEPESDYMHHTYPTVSILH